MRVLILGSGVIGTTTAYYLAKSGHEVTVVDRQPSSAMETSFANAGQVSPGYSAPWAGPGMPLKALSWLFMQHGPLVLRLHKHPEMIRWLLPLLRNCTAARYRTNKDRMVRLAEYSRDCMIALRAETALNYDHRTQGTLQLFRTQKQLDSVGKDIEILKQYGVPFELFNGESFLDAEPALSGVKHKFVGGLRLPNDETGDCYKFTQSLAKLAQSHGAVFNYGTNIIGLNTRGNQIDGVETSLGTLSADRYVLATGSYSPFLCKPLGLKLPIYPIKGFSLTIPIEDAAMAPESTVMDETHKVALTRLGDRIRVGGTAQLSGYDLDLQEHGRNTLNHVFNDVFPHAGDSSKAEFWTGLRPMTPDGTPIVGKTPYNNLLLNTGHGTLGWTMAAGSARLIDALINGENPDIDTEGLDIQRYS